MEETLLAAYLAGDQLAFSQLVLLYRKPAVLFALRLTRSLPCAEDAVQEAFAWMLTYPNRIKAEYGFKALLYTLVRRRCMDWFRSLRKTVPLDEASGAGVYAPDAVFAFEESQALYKALAGLRPRYARIIHLVDLDGFSQKEAAQILGMTAGALKTAHHRAKEQLRRCMQKEASIS